MILNAPRRFEGLWKEQPIANLLKVLVTPLKLLHMGGQVAVDKAEASFVQIKANRHAALVALK